MQFGVVLGELHGVGEGPLMDSDFAGGGAHEDGAHFVNYQQLSDVVRIGPHDSKLLRSSFSIELGDAFRVADCHDVEDAVEGSSDAFGILVPDFEKFGALAGHDAGASVAEHALEEHVLFEEV
jgi:hypothetical protein